MHDDLNSFKQNPSQKFHKYFINFEKPQKFSKTPKVRSECMKCMIKGQKEDHTRVKMQGLDRRMSGEDEECEVNCFGRGRYDFLSRKIGEK